jgi:hypothetical protein
MQKLVAADHDTWPLLLSVLEAKWTVSKDSGHTQNSKPIFTTVSVARPDASYARHRGRGTS